MTNIKQKAVELKMAGMSSREIAALLDVSKSAVNNWVIQWFNNPYSIISETPKQKKPNILLFDLETAPTIAATFGRYNQNISQSNVISEGGWMLTAAYKWYGTDEIIPIFSREEIRRKSDTLICDKLWELYEQADAVVAHNARKFDHKVLQTRCALNGLPPLPSVKVIDTLAMAKQQFKFNSNKLDSLSHYIGNDGKMETGGMKLWLDVMSGNREALQKMVEYNKKDVQELEDVYNILRPFGNASTFNAANYYDDNLVRCHVCGSTDVEVTGRNTYSQISKFEEVRCNDCGAVSKVRQSLTTPEKRAKILVPTT